MTMALKRSLPTKIAKMHSRKKQRIDRTAVPAKGSQKSIGDVVSADSLPWRKVPLPDHLDDYEGFFGLEEIDDVTVEKEDSGKVSFRVAGRNAIPKVSVSEDGEEWDGFSDGHSDGEPAVSRANEGHVSDDQESEESEPFNSKKSSREELSLESFAVLQQDDQDDAEEEDVDLPEWQKLGVSSQGVNALAKLKFIRPTAIQRAAIPHILEGNDLIGKAQTGSGKTLAFGIPILDHILSEQQRIGREIGHPSALIILPTRELAHQIEKHLKALCSKQRDLGEIMFAVITGGLSVFKQKRLLTQADVVIATPGRIWEIISESQGVLDPLQKIQYLVLDEADRLLSEGHFKELEELLSALDRQATDAEPVPRKKPVKSKPSNRQTLVFSATFSKGLQQKLAKQTRFRYDIMSNQASMEYLLQKLNFRTETPKFVDVNPTVQLASKLEEGLLQCANGMEKDLYLYALMNYFPTTRTLIFVNSIDAIRRLVPFFQNLNRPAIPLHSQMIQKARLRNVERFSGHDKAKDPTKDSGSILIATDVAARGLDIPNVGLVVHYHLPRAADTYVHRSGRTARAEASGSSVLICAPEEAAGMRRLIAQVHAKAGAGPTERPMEAIYLDKTLVSRLRPRAALAKKIADVELAKEKRRGEDRLLAEGAEDLGIDLDDDFYDGLSASKRGRGKERGKRERQALDISKAELGAAKAELKELLKQRVNTGVSERYPTGGRIDMNALIENQGRKDFLGGLPRLGFAGV